MALKYSYEELQSASLLEACIEKVLGKGYRTPDLIMGEEGTLVSTTSMTDKIINELNEHK